MSRIMKIPMRLCPVLWLIMAAALAWADGYERQPAIDILHYEIALELTDDSDTVQAATRISVRMLRDGVEEMWLDFTGMSVDELRMGGTSRTFVHRNGRLSFRLDRTYNYHEIAAVEVRYHGKLAGSGWLAGKNHYGHQVYFAENWPDYAHHWFPSVDHPSDKAMVDFFITAPEKYEVVANGRLIERRSLLDGRKLTRWRENVPIPTYCMVVGAAEFSVTGSASPSGIPLEFYAYPQDADAASRKFKRSNLMLQYFAERVGPYPFEKLAQVEATTKIGGMENSSVIFYTETLFQNDSSGEFPVAHETAHQWFGDSITPQDWDHLWLSEGFATYFETLFYEALEEKETTRQRMARNAEAVKKYHREHPGPIVDPSVKDITAKLNPLNYEKGAWVLHMLRRILGDEVFFRGIRRYYSIYAGGTVLTGDFQKVMESESGLRLEEFFKQWLYQPGWPEYQITWHWNAMENQVELTIVQTQKTGLFTMPIEAAFRCGDKTIARTFQNSLERQEIRIPLPCKPSTVEIDPEGWALEDVVLVESE